MEAARVTSRSCSIGAFAIVGGLALLASTGCGVLGPSCIDESGPVFHANAIATAGGVIAYTVASPKSSNLIMRLTWPERDATLRLSATIIDCGGHVGCQMATTEPPFGPGGSSPIPQPWPPGLREMLVDGWKGKTYRVEIGGDPTRDTAFELAVTYDISCER